MKRKLPLVVLSISTAILAVRAESAESGFHAGIAVGRSSVDGRAKVPPRITFSPPSVFPTDVVISGLPFKDDNTAWSAFVGYTAHKYLGVELGYWDHGSFDMDLTGPQSASVSAKELYFGATLHYPLLSRLSVSASAGISRAKFDADGTLTVLVLIPGNGPFAPPIGIAPATLPIATPEDETGGYWRAGLDWRFSDSFEAGLSYGKRDVQVFQIKSTALSLRYHF
jgi:hypothetical protein